MKTTFTRRIVAAISAAGLLLVGVPLAAGPAQAATACAAGTTCEGALTGSLGSTAFTIKMPTKFNGTVLMYSHGYRISTPIPAALAVPLGLASSASYQKIAFAAFTPVFGTDVAYIGSGVADVAPTPQVEEKLLAQGYALAGVGYSRQGWAIDESVQANELLLKHVKAGAIKGVKKVMAWGDSFGGFTAATFAEKNVGKVDGLMPNCAPLAGPEAAMNSAMTVLFTWKTLIAPNLRVANYTSYGQALTDLATVLQTLNGVATGTVSTSSVGYPVAQANLLGGLMAGLPTASPVYDGITQNPAFATLGTAAALAGGFQPASAGASSAAAMLQNVGAAAALGVMVRYDLEQKARLTAGIPATESANFTDNVLVSYTDLLSDEQRGEFGDTLNATTVLPNALNAMLAKLDSSKGDAASRFPDQPEGRQGDPGAPSTQGRLHGAHGHGVHDVRPGREPRQPGRLLQEVGRNGQGEGQDAGRRSVLHGPAGRRLDAVPARRQGPGRRGLGGPGHVRCRPLQLDRGRWHPDRQRDDRAQPDGQQPDAQGRQERQPPHVGHGWRERRRVLRARSPEAAQARGSLALPSLGAGETLTRPQRHAWGDLALARRTP